MIYLMAQNNQLSILQSRVKIQKKYIYKRGNLITLKKQISISLLNYPQPPIHNSEFRTRNIMISSKKITFINSRDYRTKHTKRTQTYI